MERTRRSRDESCSLERGHHKRKRKRSRSDSSSRERKKKHTRPRKLKSKKSKKRKRDVGLSDSDTDSSSDSDFSSSGESSDSSSSHTKHRKKKKMKTKKAKKKTDFKMKRKRKHKHGKQVEKEKGKQVSERPGSDINRTMVESKPTPNLKAMIAAQTSKVRGPMTKEEYEKQQSVVRRVFDPDTGRHRLIKGDGEIIEEIVSREQQKAINKKATLGDGYSFQAQMKKFL